MELQQHGAACFINDSDSQRSHGASNASNSSDRSEHFTKQFFKTQNKGGFDDQKDDSQKKTNIILDRVEKKMDTRRMEQTMTSSERPEPGQAQARMGNQAPMIPKLLMNTT